MSDALAEPRPLPRRNRYYLATRGLVSSLRAVVGEELAGRTALRIVDVGCGSTPYRCWFEPHSAHYIGVDGHAGDNADVVSRAEALPFADGSFDLSLSTQVLEHVDCPGAVVRELHRVLVPDGLCLLTTHGTFIYHPDPVDYWRWTGAGLDKVLRDAGFTEVRVVATEGIASAVGSLISYYAATFCDRVGWIRWLTPLVVLPISLLAPRLDRYLGWTFPDHPLPVNWLAIARKSGPPTPVSGASNPGSSPR